ncbi:MAG: hypothetical protein HAW61_02530 [Candidatus Portiera sp.]|nr:hypothetical protein [Portiera sp.]
MKNHIKALCYLLAIALSLILISLPAIACDVWVNAYTKSDGTYVRGHCRSRPDNQKWNNYGPSRSTPQLTNPYLRDNDRDGISNQYDYADDNDRVFDNYDRTQYGGYGRSRPKQDYKNIYDYKDPYR